MTIERGLGLTADAGSTQERAERKPNQEMYLGRLMDVVNPDRQGWWRYHDHYDRNGYCDNPGRGY